MRKKIIFMFVCLFAVFGFANYGYAVEEDHSLNYDIEEFRMDGDYLIIKGWAFIHNYDNKGGDTFNLSFYFESGTKQVGFDSVSLEPLNDFKAIFVDRNLTSVMCYRSGGVCTGDYYKYENVGFEVRIPLDKYLSQLSNNTWNLKIRANHLIAGVKVEDLAVYESIADIDTFGENEFLLSGIGKYIEVTGNHVVHPDGGYWKLTSVFANEKYEVKSRIEAGSSNTVSKYELYNGGYTSRLTYNYNNCGFDYADLFCLEKSSCVQPGRTTTDLIFSTFVKPSGNVQLKYVGDNDKYCSVSSGTGNSCDGSMSYSCNEMTANDGSGHTANVSIVETAIWNQGEFDNSGNFIEDNKPFSKTIVAGKGFKYGIKYTDTVTITLDVSTRSYSSNTYDRAILENLGSSTYYKGLNANNFKISLASSWNYKDPEFNKGGSWSCETAKKDYNSNNTKLTITQTCYYKLKESAIVYHGLGGYPVVSYFDSVSDFSSSDYYSTGKYYYIPLNYPNGKFEWDLVISNLGTYNFITGENNLKKSLDWKIDTSSNDYNTCYVNVEKTNNTVGDICVGTGCGDSENEDANYFGFYIPVYRSINYLNPFPNYSVYPDNWESYDSTHKYLRILQSYSRNNGYPVYKTKRKIKDIDINYFDYTTYDDINAPGGDADLVSLEYFDTISRYHCRWGVWNSECDK